METPSRLAINLRRQEPAGKICLARVLEHRARDRGFPARGRTRTRVTELNVKRLKPQGGIQLIPRVIVGLKKSAIFQILVGEQNV